MSLVLDLATPRVQRPRSALSALFREHGGAFRAAHAISHDQRRALGAMQACRTAALGGHLDVCSAACGFSRPVYNSCRNRHCPACQARDQAKWIAARQARVLPTPHFHTVFTLPSELRDLARAAPRVVFAAMFGASAAVLKGYARRKLRATPGITAVLHTWTRTMAWHPHVHAVVTAGGLTDDGAWAETSRRFLFPIAGMRRWWRTELCRRLLRAFDNGELEGAVPDRTSLRRTLRAAKRKTWVVYAKAPFGGAKHVFAYLGRYTHRVAISDGRVLTVTREAVTFRTRGAGVETLTPSAFIGRFLQHVLPGRFRKIRHYGLYAGAGGHGPLDVARAALDGAPPLSPPPEEADRGDGEAQVARAEPPSCCPDCGCALVRFTQLPGAGPSATLDTS